MSADDLTAAGIGWMIPDGRTSDLGSTRHHFLTWTDPHGVQTLTSAPPVYHRYKKLKRNNATLDAVTHCVSSLVLLSTLSSVGK